MLGVSKRRPEPEIGEERPLDTGEDENTQSSSSVASTQTVIPDSSDGTGNWNTFEFRTLGNLRLEFVLVDFFNSCPEHRFSLSSERLGLFDFFLMLTSKTTPAWKSALHISGIGDGDRSSRIRRPSDSVLHILISCFGSCDSPIAEDKFLNINLFCFSENI